jgi:hypothetical protein
MNLEADCHSANQEIPRFLWNNYHIYNSPTKFQDVCNILDYSMLVSYGKRLLAPA